MINFQIYLVLEQHIYLSGEKTSYIIHTRKINHFLNAKLVFASSTKMFIQTSSRPALKKHQHSLSKRSYCSVPVTIRTKNFLYHLSANTKKIALSQKNNDLHVLQTLHSTEEFLLKYDVSFRRILISQRANTNLPSACMKVLQSNNTVQRPQLQHSFPVYRFVCA